MSPLQVSSMAHTLTSTHPVGRRSSRKASSVRSVGTPLERFGHATQTTPSGPTAAVRAGQRRTTSARRVKKASTRSSGGRALCFQRTPGGSGARRSARSSGTAPAAAMVAPSLIPSLRASGVPE